MSLLTIPLWQPCLPTLLNCRVAPNSFCCQVFGEQTCKAISRKKVERHVGWREETKVSIQPELLWEILVYWTWLSPAHLLSEIYHRRKWPRLLFPVWFETRGDLGPGGRINLQHPACNEWLRVSPDFWFTLAAPRMECWSALLWEVNHLSHKRQRACQGK